MDSWGELSSCLQIGGVFMWVWMTKKQEGRQGAVNFEQ
jgi:hypothetical protein